MKYIKYNSCLYLLSGDIICVCINVVKPGDTEVLFLINNKVGHREVMRHNILDRYRPTICFTSGSATLRVAWPYPDGMKTNVAQFTPVSEQEKALTMV